MCVPQFGEYKRYVYNYNYSVFILIFLPAFEDQIDISSVYIDETFGIFDYEILSGPTRMNMCREAVRIVNGRKEGVDFQVAENHEASVAKSFILDMNSDSRLVLAFICPTQPFIALLVYEQNAVQIVGIIVRYVDLRSSIDLQNDGIHYSMKLVTKIIPTKLHGIFIYLFF